MWFFSPIAKWDTIRAILALTTCNNWEVYQLDVKSEFLHGELLENVYVDKPLGYEKEGR